MLGNRMMVVGGTALALLLAGCNSPADNSAESPDAPSVSGAADASSTAPATSQPATSPSTPPATPSRSPDPRPPADAAVCQVEELELSLGGGEGAAGTVYRELRFTNVGDRTCEIQGFPGVSYVAGDDGHQVGPAAVRDGEKGPPISLAPGQTVFAPVGFVQVRNYDPAVCEPTEVRGLRVYPPHEYDSEFVPHPGVGCAGDPPGHQLVVRTVQR